MIVKNLLKIETGTGPSAGPVKNHPFFHSFPSVFHRLYSFGAKGFTQFPTVSTGTNKTSLIS